ncbi:MAG: hypothetical protein V3W41_09245 [Planctomycetota bacterium]
MRILAFGLVALFGALGLGSAFTASPSLDGGKVYVVTLKGLA